MHGIVFLSGSNVVFNSAAEGWVMPDFESNPPSPQYNFVAVPGRNGALNLSRAITGSIAYEQRKLTANMATTAIMPRSSATKEMARIVALLHGKKLTMLTPEGRFDSCEVAVTSTEYVGSHAVIQLEALTDQTSATDIPQEQTYRITLQPQDIYLDETDQSYTLQSRSNDTYARIQWQRLLNREWTDIAGATKSSLTLSVEDDSPAYIDYRCVFRCSDGSVLVSNTARVHIRSFVITAQPQSVSIHIIGDASFAIETNDTGASYQWQESANGSTWVDSARDGATTKQLSVNNATSALNGYRFRCVVDFSDDTTETSNSAALNVTAPAITTQPTDQSNVLGKDVTFEVATNDEGATYQWQTGYSGHFEDIPDATGSSYSVEVSSQNNGDMFRCVVSCSDGTTLISDAAELDKEPFRITEQPQDNTIPTATSAVSFHVVTNDDNIDADGNGFRWQYSSNGGEAWAQTYLSGWKTDTLAFNSTASRAANIFRCVVTFSDGTTETSESAAIIIQS